MPVLPTAPIVSPVLTRQGERRVINWHNAVIHDREGEIVGSLSSGEDITERLRAENALNEKHAELTQIFEAIPDAMVYANLDRRVIRVRSSIGPLCISARLGIDLSDRTGEIVQGRNNGAWI